MKRQSERCSASLLFLFISGCASQSRPTSEIWLDDAASHFVADRPALLNNAFSIRASTCRALADGSVEFGSRFGECGVVIRPAIHGDLIQNVGYDVVVKPRSPESLPVLEPWLQPGLAARRATIVPDPHDANRVDVILEGARDLLLESPEQDVRFSVPVDAFIDELASAR